MRSETEKNSFRRGVMSLVLLALLKQKDMYGYQLVLETKRQSGDRIITQEGSLYPVLYKLQEQGMVSDYRVQVGKRMTRIYYHLEPAGEEKLRELMQEYNDISTGLRMITEGSQQ